MKKLFTLLLLTLSLLQAVAFVVPVNPSQRQFRVSSSLSTLPTRTQVADESGITVTYNFSALSVVPDSMLYPDSYFLGFQGWFNTPVAGKPSLPETHDLFLLPPGASDISVEVLENEAYTHPYKPTPGRTWLSNEVTESYTFDNVPPIDNNLLPQTYTPVCIEYIGKKRNDVLVAVTVIPIQYNPTESDIRVSSTLTYRLNYTISPSYTTEQCNKSVTRIATLDSIPHIPNPESPVNSYLEALRRWNQVMEATNDSTLREEDDYLIISTPKYVTALHNFVQWKRECGHKVQLLYRYDWTPELIKSEIRNAYEKNPFLKYIVFAGSIDEVPPMYDYNTDTDYPYCCDGDPYWYTSKEEKDYLRQLYSGRFLVSDSKEMHAIVNKIVNYEKNGIADKSVYKKAFHVAFFEDGYPYRDNNKPFTPANGIEDTRMTLTSEEVRKYTMSQGFDVKRLYGIWPYQTDPDYNSQWPHSWSNYPRPQTEEWITPLPDDLRIPNYWFTYNTSHIKAAFNEGASYALAFTHGGQECWHNPNFTSDDVRTLSNGDKLPIVFSTGCQTGSLRNPNSFSKVLLAKNDGGAVAVLSSTLDLLITRALALGMGYINTIWPNPGIESNYYFTSEGTPSYPILEYSYCSLKEEDRLTLGSILEGGILFNWHLFGCGSYTKPDPFSLSGKIGPISLAHMTHLFGDPGMMFPTEAVEAIPSDSVSVNINFSPDRSFSDGSYRMVIGVSLPFEAKIGLYNKTTRKIERYYGKTALVYAPSNKNEYVLSIVKANKLPYFLSITEESIKTMSKVSSPQLTSVSQKPGDSSVDVTVDFKDCSPERSEITVTDIYGNTMGKSTINPEENSCTVKVTQPTSGVGLVMLSADGVVVDATKINIIK